MNLFNFLVRLLLHLDVFEISVHWKPVHWYFKDNQVNFNFPKSFTQKVFHQSHITKAISVLQYAIASSVSWAGMNSGQVDQLPGYIFTIHFPKVYYYIMYNLFQQNFNQLEQNSEWLSSINCNRIHVLTNHFCVLKVGSCILNCILNRKRNATF